MAPLTWREVSAPDFRSVTDAYRLVGSSINAASEGLQKAVANYQDQRTQSDSSRFMGQLLAGTAVGDIKNIDPSYLSPEAFNFAAKLEAQKSAEAIANARLGAKGGGKGGKGGGDGFPVAGAGNRNVIGAYDAQGNFIPAAPGTVTPTNVPAGTDTPDEVVPVAATSIANAVDPRIPAGGPTIENAQALQTVNRTVGAPQTSMVPPAAVAPVSVPEPTMAELTGNAPVNPAPVMIAQTVGGQVRAPTGTVVTPQKFNKDDPLKQVNPNAMKNIGEDRLFGATGVDPLSGVRSLLNDQNFLQNTGVAGGLTTLDKTIDFSLNADKSVQSRQDTIAKTQDFQKSQVDKAFGNALKDEIIADFGNVTSADELRKNIQAKVGNNPYLREKVANEVKDLESKGAFNLDEDTGDLTPDGKYRPPAYLNIDGIRGELPVTEQVAIAAGEKPAPDGTVTDPKTIGQAAAPAPSTPAIQSAASSVGSYKGSALDAQKNTYQIYKDTLNRDISADQNRRLLTDYNKLAKSNKAPIDVANDLLAEKGAFRTSGATPAVLTTLVDTISRRLKTSPELAGRLLSMAPRDQWAIEKWNPFTSNAEDAVDTGKFNEIANKFVGADGKPTFFVVDNLNRLRAVDQQDKKADAAMGALERAQRELETATEAQRQGRGKGTNLELLKKNQETALAQFNRIVAANMDPQTGITYQNAKPPAVPEDSTKNIIAPQNGPFLLREVPNTASQSISRAIGSGPGGTAQDIYVDLVRQLGRPIGPGEASVLYKRAQDIASGRISK